MMTCEADEPVVLCATCRSRMECAGQGIYLCRRCLESEAPTRGMWLGMVLGAALWLLILGGISLLIW